MGTLHPRPTNSSVLDAYPVRIMLGLVASLSLLLALVRLPLRTSTNRVGWSTHPSAQQIILDDVIPDPPDDARSNEPEDAPPATDLQFPRSDEQQARPASSETSAPESDSSDSNRLSEYTDVQSVDALSVKDRAPRIVGGMGTLHLHINYPKKARLQGIEGELELEFTIKPDGSVTDVEIADSLHPLCDSAAVRGLRSVKFVPAKQDGTLIPIRMKLPVRFQLTAASKTTQTDGSGP